MVDGIEEDGQRPENQERGQQGEHEPQRLVQPSQHRELQHPGEQPPHEHEQQGNHDQDQRERDDLQHRRRDFRERGHLLPQPAADHVREVEGDPDAGNQRQESGDLRDESFLDAVERGGDEAQQDNDVEHAEMLHKMLEFAIFVGYKNREKI